MDKLSDIPSKNDTVKTPEEEAVMNQFFSIGSTIPQTQGYSSQHPQDFSSGARSQAMVAGQPSGCPPQCRSSKLNWKFISLSAILFVLLANPWIDQIFCKIPYCGSNVISLLGIKVLLFLILIIVLCLFT